MHAVELENFPPGNPFHHDLISCGMRLRDIIPTEREQYKGVYIMGSSMNDSYDLYIVNSNTGERIGIKL